MITKRTPLLPLLLLLAACGGNAPDRPASLSAEPPAPIASEIALDQPWKTAVHDFATSRLAHPAWGWTHSRRVYHLALAIAEGEGHAVDRDILFAAAFLHDMGAISPFAAEGVDHADRSAELAEPLLRDAGFPMEKFPGVRAAILTHMFDRQPEGAAEAIVLHDADAVDFLGVMGFARRLSVTGDAKSFANGIRRLESVIVAAPAGIVTATGRAHAAPRVREMEELLAALNRQALGVPY